MGNLATPKSVQKLQTALHAKAKAEAGYRFYALYDKISRDDIRHCRADRADLKHCTMRSRRRETYRRIAWRTRSPSLVAGMVY